MADPSDDLIARALHLWGGPLPAGPAALDAFRGVYTDPVTVNGEITDLQVLVDRARMMLDAFEGLTHHIDDLVVTPGRRAFAFRITARHVGPLATPLGVVAPTGRALEVQGMDIFDVDEDADRVTRLWAVADYLGLLMRLGAAELVEPALADEP